MTDRVAIRRANEDEARALSDLAYRSKAYWGYSEEFMRACRAELTYTASDIRNLRFAVAETEGRIAGFYALEMLSPGEVELEALFVEPDLIGRGIGRALIEHAKESAASNGAVSMVIQGDPNAADFYRAAGGKAVGRRESASIRDRFLPLFRVPLRSPVSSEGEGPEA